MCLATVYLSEDEDADPVELIDKVQAVSVDDETITCTNLYGQSARAKGRLSYLDLVHSRIYLIGASLDSQLEGEKDSTAPARLAEVS